MKRKDCFATCNKSLNYKQTLFFSEKLINHASKHWNRNIMAKATTVQVNIFAVASEHRKIRTVAHNKEEQITCPIYHNNAFLEGKELEQSNVTNTCNGLPATLFWSVN